MSVTCRESKIIRLPDEFRAETTTLPDSGAAQGTIAPDATQRRTKDWEEVLNLLHFPASLSEIMKRARDIGVMDYEVHERSARLQRDSYDTLEQFTQDIRDIYLADGTPPDKSPL